MHFLPSKFIFFLSLFALVTSCKKENALDCFKSNGSEITETRYPGTFNTIQVESKIEINIKQGTECKLEVIAGKHIIKNISTKVNDGILVISNDNTCNFVRGYKKSVKVEITAPYIKFIKNEGVGTVTILEGFEQDTLVVRTESSGDIYINGKYNQIRTSSHGNGDIYINGSTNSFNIYTFGTNFIHAENLIVNDFAFVHTLTLGDCFINAVNLKELSYNIGSSGNIYYKGNPPLIVDVSEVKAKGLAIKE